MANVITEISNMSNMISWEGNTASEEIPKNPPEPNLYLAFSLRALLFFDINVYCLSLVITVGLLYPGGGSKKHGPESSICKLTHEASSCLKRK